MANLSPDLLEHFSLIEAERFLQQLSNSAYVWEEFETTTLMYMLDSPETFTAPIESISVLRH